MTDARRVLVVEDEDKLAALLCDYLRAAGYDKPFKTVAEGVTEYMAWLNRDA